MSGFKSTCATLALLAFAGQTAAAADPADGIEPVQDRDFYQDGRPDPAEVELGRLLFFDKVLSGNRNIACATCHHPSLGTTDRVSLALGEGASGLGEERRADSEMPMLGRVPRNAQALYFLGAKEFQHLYHDGRVEPDPHGNWQSGYWSPAREQLPPGLDNVLAVQAMFPVLSAVEMAGHKGENEIAEAAVNDRLDGEGGAWALIAQRLQAIPAYVEHFSVAFENVQKADDITFVHAANAIAAFEASAFRADGSPFDRYLESRAPDVLSKPQRRGMAMFYGDAGCAACHGGKFQTDQQFHAIAMPQIGPGKNDGMDQSYWQETGFVGRFEDFGRFRVTYRAEDRYSFRTPSLRNVTLTGPWGHSGAYNDLADVVRHHLDPVERLAAFDAASVDLPPISTVIERTGDGSELIFSPINPKRLGDYRRRDGWVQSSPDLKQAIAAANDLAPRSLDDDEVDDLIAFLDALTDPASRDQSDLVPTSVPSGLPVQD